MSDRYFLDTNIFVYSFDPAEQEKRKVAQALIEDALISGNGIISFQVIQEFLNVSTRKFAVPMSIAEAQVYLEEVLLPLCEVYPGNAFYTAGLEIKERTGFTLYDSLIVQAALLGNCRILYSEDLQNGFKLYDLTINNPFV